MKKTFSSLLVYRPRKKLGQNFLFDEIYLQQITKTCPVDPHTVVIEIGGGYGNLTKYLAQTNCQKVISLEKDFQLFRWLTEDNLSKDKVLFFHQDALKVDWLNWSKKWKASSLVVVGNLPYYLANSLIVDLLLCGSLFKALILLAQKEVVQKWVASPLKYTYHYSALSVFINYLARAEITLIVPARYFIPTPPVDGALVKIEPYSLNLNSEILAAFLSFIKQCFHFRRKTLLNNLNSFQNFEKNKWIHYFQQKNYSPQLRPQNLTPQEYWELFTYWKQTKL